MKAVVIYEEIEFAVRAETSMDSIVVVSDCVK